MTTRYQSIPTADKNALVIIQTAIGQAKRMDKQVKRTINGIPLTIHKNSSLERVFQDYKMSHYFANN
jgi:hypothetical protein